MKQLGAEKLEDGYLQSVTNFFDRGVNHIIKYVNRQIDQGKLKDASTKKAPIWFTSRGLQLPKLVQTIIDANNSVAEKTKKSTNSGEKVPENSGAKRSALSKPSGDEMIRQAVARGYGDKSGANSQTSEKAKPGNLHKSPLHFNLLCIVFYHRNGMY